jgi:hypothetical protein
MNTTKTNSAEQEESRYAFGEAVADIARNFAFAQLWPEDSREFTRLCIEWAETFEARNAHREWGQDGGSEYIEAIDAHFGAEYQAWEDAGNGVVQNPALARLKKSGKR